jgi:uncharacterized membrane protein YcaP (DUF421 family)
VKDGRLQPEALRREHMNEKDALAELRLQGVDDVREVRLAQVEVDGQVSVIREEWASPAEKADVSAEAARQRDRARRQAEPAAARGV